MHNGMQIFQSPTGVNETGHQGDGAIRITMTKEYSVISNQSGCSHVSRVHIFVFIAFVYS